MNKIARCGGVVFAAEQVLTKGREWHRKCFKCKDCSKTLDSIIACDGPDKVNHIKVIYIILNYFNISLLF